jgi:hypothetical protein
MDTLFAFFAGMFLSWPSLITLFIFGVLAEHNDSRGWAVFWSLLIIPSCYFFFDLSFKTMLVYSLLYITIGVFWSFFRYKRFIIVEAQAIRDNPRFDENEKRNRAKYLHPTKQLDTITAWIIVWPFSAIENFAGDLIDAIRTLVTKVFKGVYYKIYTSTMGDLLD